MRITDNKQRGSSLIMVVLLTFVLSIMAASMMQIALEGYSESTRAVQKEKAFRIAESGLMVYQRLWSEMVEIRNYHLTNSHREEIIKQINEKLAIYGRTPELKLVVNEDGSDTLASSGSLGWFQQEITLNATSGTGPFGRAVVSAATKLPDAMLEGAVVTQSGSAPSVGLRESDLALGLRESRYSKEFQALYDALDSLHPLPSPVASNAAGMPTVTALNSDAPVSPAIQSVGSMVLKLDCATVNCVVNGDIRVGGNLRVECLGVCGSGQNLTVRGSMIVNGDIQFDAPFANLNMEGGLASGGDAEFNQRISGQIAQAFIVSGTLNGAEWNGFLVKNDLVVGKDLNMNRWENVQIDGVWLNAGNVQINQLQNTICQSAVAIGGNFEVPFVSVNGLQVTGSGTRFAENWKHFNGLLLVGGNVLWGREQGNSLSAINIKGFLISNANIQIQGFSSNADIQLGGMAAKNGFSLGNGPWRSGLITIRLNQPDPNQAQNGLVRFEIDYDPIWKSEANYRQTQ